MFAFEKLEVWQKSRSYAKTIMEAVESFPKIEQFALSQQLRRAVVSIAANIAEGSSRSSKKEFSRYVEIAYGSLCEVIAELFVALDRDYLPKEAFDVLYTKSEDLGKMLSRFRGALETSWIKTR
ncbi:MAG: four helix bundle protein [Armatimonadetes bacterium]|nr:four helix bundle protein [Armatimonadota bacterium]